jgi:DNA-binding transcriptional LysR family regulator
MASPLLSGHSTRNRMKLHDLRILMAVAHAGSMNKAAVFLNMTQSAVSRSIAELERIVGVSLLDRTARGVEPTEYRRAMLECRVAVFDDLRQGAKKIEFLADRAAGEVRIGCHPGLALSFVPAVVDEVARRYPRIVFDLVVAEVVTLHRELTERNVDLLITREFRPLADERLSFEFLFDDSFIVVAGAQNPWVRRRKIVLTELLNEAWALPPPETVFGSFLMGAFRCCGLDYPRTTVVTIPTDLRMSLLATGHFLTIFVPSVLRFCVRRPELKVLPVELPLARVPSGIVTLKNRTLSYVAHLFVDAARKVAKPLPRRK